MFSAIFYKHTKRVNSTLQPSSGTEYKIDLKADSSVLTPTIELDLGQDGNPSEFNYCYIEEFHRYYWVTWTWRNRLWVGSCKVDSLASWKSYIGSYSGYVSRAASSYDGKIMDLFYPAKADITETKVDAAISPDFTRDYSSGTFVIGIQGKASGPNGGAVTYYAVKPAAIQAITDYLLDVTNLTVPDISDDLLKCIFNPMQFIVSCQWFPFSMVMDSDPIYVGWWTITTGSGTCKKLSDLVYTRNVSYTVPKHPQAATRGAYLNMQPFSSYVINAGPWGVIPINNQQLIDESTLSCIMNIDLMTGSGRFSIIGKNSLCYIQDHVCQVGVPVQLGQNMFNQGALMSSVSNIVDTGKAALSGSPVRMLTSGYSAIGDVASLSQAVPISAGSNGSMAFNNTFNMIGRFLTVVDEDLASRGRPLCKAVTLNTLSGFVLCEDADPAIPCTDGELTEIINYLNGGFYYE